MPPASQQLKTAGRKFRPAVHQSKFILWCPSEDKKWGQPVIHRLPRLLFNVQNTRQKDLENIFPGSVEVETVKVHNLAPRRDKVVQEPLLGVLTTIDFRDGPQLGV